MNRLNDFFQFKFEPDTPEIPNSTLIYDIESLINNSKFHDIIFVVEEKEVQK